MRIPRGYHDGELAPGAEVVLDDTLASHLTRVLRLRAGDAVQLFDGRGHEVRAVLAVLERKRTTARVEGEIAPVAESPLRLTLAQGICRGEKMDLVLQKATELGAHAILPLMTERTEVRLDAEREAKRMAHWRQVIASACEQCGRATLPQLAAPLGLPQWLAALRDGDDPADMKLILDPGGATDLRSLAPGGSLTLAVGPEGGFSEAEVALMQRAGFLGLRLGPRILRTETAGLAAIAALQARFGDL